MALKPIEILINAKDNASGVFDKLQAKLAVVGAAIAGYFGIQAFQGIVSSAADFESAMSRVQMATEASAEEMAQLRAAAEEASKTSKFSAVEAAEGLENLAKAGLSAKDSIAALPGAIALAEAGDISLATSSEYLTKIISGMGEAFDQTGRYADVLAKGANASNTSVTGLAQALSYAAPTAKSLNLSLETTVALVGKLADGGIDASRAGTALNAIFSQFLDPASKFRAELGAIGIVTNNFEQALRQLAASGAKGQKAILAVGTEAGPALRSLLNQGMPALDTLIEQLKNAEGSAAAAAATMQNNLNGSLSKLRNVWEGVKTALGTPVLPVLKQGIEDLVGALRGAVEDGTVARFGEAIAKAFQQGVKFVKDFLGTIDFAEVTARVQTFASEANETFTKIGEYATNAGNTVKLAYGVMSAGVNAVLTAIYGIGTAFTETAGFIVQAGIKINEQLQKIAIGDAKDRLVRETEQMRSVLEGLEQAGGDFSARMKRSFGDVADGAQTARDGFAGLVGATNDSARANDNWAATVAKVAAEIEAAGKAQAEANAKAAAAKKSTEDQEAAAEAARKAIAALRAEYQALVQSGDVQAATEKLLEINKAMAAGPDSASKAKEAALEVAAAYRQLRMKTTEELNETAAAAQRSWDVISNSGTRSVSALRDAFVTYANDTIEAAQRQGDAAVATAQRMLAAQAAAKGLRVESLESGRVIVRAMGDAEQATNRVREAAHGAAGGYRAMGQSAEEAAAQAKKLQELYDRNKVGDGSDLVGKSRDIRYAGINQTDINQQIGQRYGEQAIGDDLAELAWQLRLQLENYQNNYGNARSAQSLLEQRNIAAELDRVERQLEARLRGNGGGGSPSRTAARELDEADSPTPSRRGGGSSSGVAGATVVNIHMDGRARSINTDSAGAQVLRELLEAKGRSR